MTGILLLDSYFVTPISIFNISPSLSSQLRTAVTLTLLEQYMFILIVVAKKTMRFVTAFIKPILCLCYVYVTLFKHFLKKYLSPTGFLLIINRQIYTFVVINTAFCLLTSFVIIYVMLI